MMNMKSISQWLDVPSTDPDDARRRKLLNILLLGAGSITLLALLATSIATVTATAGEPEKVIGMYVSGASMLLGIGIMLVINRYWSGQVASSLFLLLMIVAIVFSDQPREVVMGHNLFLFAIPILIASVILRPWVSFIAAGLSSLVIAIVALGMLHMGPPLPSMMGLFAVALVAWLAAHTLERALEGLRTVNRELEQRADERTRDLAELSSRTEAILTGIADGVIVFDNDGVSTVTNPAMVHMLGKPSHEIVGHSLDALMEGVNREDQEVICDLVRDSLTSYPSLKFNWGGKILSTSFAAVRDNAGRRTGTVAVFRDLTREAELERVKSVFVSIISHELRTPLNAILGYADMLKEAVYGPITDRQLDALGRIIVNSKRQLSIVNDLLDQAQIEAGTLTIKVAPFTPDDLIDDVMGVMDALAQSKGLELASHIADDVPDTLPGDRQRLYQILINLVGNAIKFTDEGSVRVRVYRPNATQWAVDVSDTGCGIPLEAQSYVFDPFRQVDGSVTREHAGFGLGLSIVKQLTALMGGDITLTSTVEEGSTFTIILPLVPIQEEEPL